MQVKADQSRMIYDFLCIEERIVLVQENMCEKYSNKIGLRSFDNCRDLNFSLHMVKPYNNMLYEMLIIYQLLPMRAKKCQDQKNKDYTTNYFLKTHILRKLGRPTE